MPGLVQLPWKNCFSGFALFSWWIKHGESLSAGRDIHRLPRLEETLKDRLILLLPPSTMISTALLFRERAAAVTNLPRSPGCPSVTQSQVGIFLLIKSFESLDECSTEMLISGSSGNNFAWHSASCAPYSICQKRELAGRRRWGTRQGWWGGLEPVLHGPMITCSPVIHLKRGLWIEIHLTTWAPQPTKGRIVQGKQVSAIPE